MGRKPGMRTDSRTRRRGLAAGATAGAVLGAVALAACVGSAPETRSEAIPEAVASGVVTADGAAASRTDAPAAGAPNVAADLEAVRAATRRFRDPEVAQAEGYLRDPMDMCLVAPSEGWPPQLGGMGIHFFRPDLLEITGTDPRVTGTGTHTDFREPGVLVYEPRPDGSLELVAVENIVFARAWREAGNESPPSFLGNEYYYMHDNPETPVDEAHGFAPHWELHVWLYRENRNGTFAQFNPAVTCDHHEAAGD